VIDDATLDLNGHTLTCARRTKDRGVKVQRATIRNGRIRGCYTAVVAYSGVVQGMVFTGNRLGVAAMEFSMIAENTAVTNDQGFSEPEDGGSNAYELSGNVAKGNGQNGFVFGKGGKFMASDNVANKNGRDGFMLWLDTDGATLTGSLTKNYARDNAWNGIAIHGRLHQEPLVPFITLSNNVALGNGAPGQETFDLTDWDVSCSGMAWSNNRFGTRSQECIE
jgi:hypothetical protein